MNEITYIFGAGASCQSMPLVANFSKRFRTFVEYIRANSFDNEKYLMLDSQEFEKQIQSHLSFDTFFKKLFHQNRNEEIDKYKSVLLAYFLYEHLVYTNSYDGIEIDSMEKKYSIDPRYDALIAGLLKPIPGKSEFYTNVNFITWNYDINLLMALKNFLTPEGNLFDFITKYRNQSFAIGKQVKLFHINGFIYHPLLKEFHSDDKESLMQSIIDDFSGNDFKKYASEIKFAWEGNVDTQLIKKCISNSSNIVLVGYSLPLYNRMIDSEYLNDSIIGSQKTIIIQDLLAENIANILSADFGIYDFRAAEGAGNINSIRLTTNCSGFTVPNSIFK